MKMKKTKLLAMVMAMVLMFQLLAPVSVIAEDANSYTSISDEEGLQSALTNGGYYRLTGNISVAGDGWLATYWTYSGTESLKLTLDLNGYTISFPINSSGTGLRGEFINCSNPNVTVTLCDSSEEGTGTIENLRQAVINASAGTFNFKGGNIIMKAGNILRGGQTSVAVFNIYAGTYKTGGAYSDTGTTFAFSGLHETQCVNVIGQTYDANGNEILDLITTDIKTTPVSVKTMYTVTTEVVSGESTGTVTAATKVEHGEDLEITVDPADGYEVASVFANETELTSENNVLYVVENVTSNQQIKVTFVVETEKELSDEAGLKSALTKGGRYRLSNDISIALPTTYTASFHTHATGTKLSITLDLNGYSIIFPTATGSSGATVGYYGNMMTCNTGTDIDFTLRDSSEGKTGSIQNLRRELIYANAGTFNLESGNIVMNQGCVLNGAATSTATFNIYEGTYKTGGAYDNSGTAFAQSNLQATNCINVINPVFDANNNPIADLASASILTTVSVKKVYSVTTTVVSGVETGSVEAPETVVHGDALEITVEPAHGYEIATVKVNGIDATTEDNVTYKVENVTSNQEVVVTFREVEYASISTESALKTALQNGGYYRLTQDITTESGSGAFITYTNGAEVDVTIDLNGKNIGFNGYVCLMVCQSANVNFTLVDSVGGGTITGLNRELIYANAGTFNLKGGTIEMAVGNILDAANSSSTAVFNIYGGTYSTGGENGSNASGTTFAHKNIQDSVTAEKCTVNVIGQAYDSNWNEITNLLTTDIRQSAVTVREAKITDASITLGESITVVYYASLGSKYKDAQMKFTMNGKSVNVPGVFVESNVYKYAFEGVAPQCMTDAIKAELIYGEDVLAVNKSYSIRQYCDELLASNATELKISDDKFGAMKTLIADLLEYGASAQKYRNYKTDTLANKDITGQSVFNELGEQHKASGPVNGENIKITAGGVWFGNVNKIYLKFKTAELENTIVKVDGETYDYASGRMERLDDETCIFYSDALLPTQFNTPIEVTFTCGNEEASISYSVNNYVYAKQSQGTAMANLAKALYNYSTSATTYVALQ